VAFETALLTYTNHLEKAERWTKIAEEVLILTSLLIILLYLF
jgi:hypothetical protein